MESVVWFRTVCRKNGLEISDNQARLIEEYVNCLLEWNQKINLVSRKDEGHIWTRHVLGSVALLFRFQFHPGSSLVDIGTGGGLPGIPLSILSDNLQVTLVDSIQKKVRAVTEILLTLKLQTVRTACGRIEELNKAKPFRAGYDYVIARGVGSISEILNWSIPTLKHVAAHPGRPGPAARPWIEKGSIILLKGGDLSQETQEARLKHTPREINSYPVAVDGIDAAELVEKKIIVIHP